MRNAGMAREVGYCFPCADFCHLVVVGKIGSEGGVCQVGNLIGADLGASYRAKRPALSGKKERRMSLRVWLFGDGYSKADRAIDLADEVTQLMRDRDTQRDPLKAVLADLFFHSHDPALIADAFEASQESRIYKGPPH